MSYNMILMCGDDVCVTTPHAEGATCCVGGTSECDLNITGNYSVIYNFRQIGGKTGGKSLPVLQGLISELVDDQGENYWKPTPGNVRSAALTLMKWASEHPEATWMSEG